MKTTLIGIATLLCTGLAPMSWAQTETTGTATCAALGGTCAEGCGAGMVDLGAHDCFDSTCCVAGGVDQSDPASVVTAVFTAAQTGNFSALGGLCDPTGGADGDMQSICGLAADPSGAAEFVEYFSAGGVAGEPTVTGETAEVPITFGPGGSETETMTLVKRGESWFLQSF